MRTNLLECENLIKKADNIAVFCHTRPDGDTLGAALGLKLALQKANKNINIFCEDVIPDKFLQFGFDGHFNTKFDNQKYDLYIAIDCGDLGRLGVFGDLFVRQKNTLTIDHHMGHDDFGAYTYVEGLSSTSEIILAIITDLKLSLDTAIAIALYIGLSTDTGNFKHGNTTKKSFYAASVLADYNIDIALISRKFYGENSFERLKLLSRALSNLRSYFDGQLCLTYLTTEDFTKANATIEDTEAFTDYTISVNTAKIGVIISQSKPNCYKVSMRSKHLDVSQICRSFGGGGHPQASGCIICGFLEDVIDKIVRAVQISLI